MGIERYDREDTESNSSGLGSLAQSARLKSLNAARWELIVIGIFSVLFNAYLLINARHELFNEFQKQGLGAAVNGPEFEQGLLIVRLVCLVPLVLGIVFIILGMMVKMYPVPITITAMVLYVLATLGFGILNWQILLQGLVFRIIVIVILGKAIQSALAYERETAGPLYEPE